MLSNIGLALLGIILAALALTFWLDALITGLPQIQPSFTNQRTDAIMFVAALILFGLFGPKQKKY